MKRLLLLLLLPAFCFGQGDQTIIKVPVDNAGGTENAILHLPDDYSTTSGTYPIIVFLHGVDEGSTTDPSVIYNNSNAGGPAYIIAHGSWPSSFVNPVDKKSYKFIVVSPQAAYGYSTTAPQLEYVLTYLLKTYRVDPTRVYLTGLSAGGEGILEYVGKIQASGASVAATHPIPAFVPMSAVMNAYYRGQYADTVVKNKVQLWGFGSATDVHGANTLNLVLDVNAIKANYALSTAYAGGHCCWEQFYDPAYTLNGMNIYQWLLQYTTAATSVTSPATPTATYYTVPGTVQAESYSTMSGVGLETTGDTGGGQDVGWIDNGDWMTYSLNVASAGSYTASFRVASPNAGAAFQIINASGAVLATVSVPNTGGYQAWQTVTATVTLPAGQQALTIKSTGTGWNFNWLQFATPVVSAAPTYYAVPGTVQGESYAAMSGVATETTGDTGGGQDVGYIDAGDYMDYRINVATAGTYNIGWRVTSPNTGVSFQLLNAAGVVLSTINVPNTGGYQTWQTVTTQAVLPAGQQTLRVKSTVTGWNFNYMTFTAAPAAAVTTYAIPGAVEAEGYASMSGVAQENTLDAGGGYDVGWIDNGDWMKYNVNVATAGSYTVSFRVAASAAGGQIQLQNASGVALATVTVPASGSYQTWETVTATAALAAGAQTLIVKSVAAGNWNINWIQFAAASSGSSSSTPSIPGTILAPSYVLMTGVGTETTSDVGGGTDLGWIDDGDWMNYTVNVTKAGVYTVSFRVATPNNNASLQLLSNGYVVANVLLPNTGAYQSWQTVTTTANLGAGVQTLQVKSTSAVGWNFHYMTFALPASASAVTNGLVSATAAGGEVDAAEAAITGADYLTIYPNPVKANFSIQMSNAQAGSLRVQLLDVTGAIRQTQEVTKAAGALQVNVNASTLAPGVYFVRMQIGNWSTVKKIVKQ